VEAAGMVVGHSGSEKGFVLTLLGILGGSLKKRSQKGKIVVSDVWASTAACI
jgi:hypothetical protein